MTTVAAALAAARAKLPASEARLLLGQVMRQGPAWLIAHDDELLDEDTLLAFAALVARRKPVASRWPICWAIASFSGAALP
jgi:methylase of polypeptide subunit release factors